MEITLEYSDNLSGPWQEYGFQYKPWNDKGSMPYAWVYFPRFDFKFYDASNAKANTQKWIYPLVQRLLQNDQAVSKLLDQDHLPNKPPTFIRASLYQFSFTSWFDGNSTTFWTRQRIDDYFAPFSLDDGFLEDKLKDVGVSAVAPNSDGINLPLKWLLNAVRNFLGFFEGAYLVLGVLAAACAMIITQNNNA